jgi:hypothetical protein
MTDCPELSKKERDLIAWCRSIRDSPLLALAMGYFRISFSLTIICWPLLAIAVAFGWIDFTSDRVVWSVVGLAINSGLTGLFWWLTSRYQRMAALIDKFGRCVETEEALRMAGVEHN